MCRQRPPTRRGSTCLSVAPLGARQNGIVSGPRASPCPHGVTGVPPWRGSDHYLPLPSPSLFGVQTPQRGTASRDALLHMVPRQPFLTRRCQRQPNMPLDPGQRLWVSPPVGEDPQQESPVPPSTLSGHQLGPQTPIIRTPSTSQGAHREEAPGG